jgi:glutaredoxin-like protein NrdH
MNAIVYSQPGCGPCVVVKNHLQDMGVEVEVRDVRANPAFRQELIDLNFQSTPVTVVEGKDPVSGFDPAKLDLLFL